MEARNAKSLDKEISGSALGEEVVVETSAGPATRTATPAVADDGVSSESDREKSSESSSSIEGQKKIGGRSRHKHKKLMLGALAAGIAALLGAARLQPSGTENQALKPSGGGFLATDANNRCYDCCCAVNVIQSFESFGLWLSVLAAAPIRLPLECTLLFFRLRLGILVRGCYYA